MAVEMVTLAVVVPTFNESENVALLVQRLRAVLTDIPYEVIFVDDDSPDGTSEVVRAVSAEHSNVRVIQRVGRRGLASACIEGMLSTAAPYIAVMDGDGQHDEAILPDMLRRLRTEDLDIVVGSRNVSGGSMGDFAESRVALSMMGRRFSQAVCRCDIQDPMSGFFMLNRAFLQEVVHKTSGIGFKILVDLLASSDRQVKLAEVPYRFRTRVAGESKLDILVGIEYIQLIVDKFIGEFVPPRFLLFAMVGCSGVVVHLATLWMCLNTFSLDFGSGQIIATMVAMTYNFLLNNTITYRDSRLRGWRILPGLLSFYVACSIGVYLNLVVAESARTLNSPWYLAGVAGLTIGSVWNFGVTQVFTWHTARRSARARARRMSAQRQKTAALGSIAGQEQ